MRTVLFAIGMSVMSDQGSVGNLLADMDLMIASIVLANDGILVTNNVKHFEKIKELQFENWTK